MLKIYLRTVRTAYKAYGFGRPFWANLLGEAVIRLFSLLTLGLDHLFFPRFRRVEVKRPVFIIGHPRSGTTFLHKLLCRFDGVAAFHTWQLLFPALSARLLVRPLVALAVRFGKTELIPAATGHRVALDEPEEEEMLFFHNYDTQFVTIGMLGLDDRDYPELRFHDQQPRARRWRSMRFFHGCLQRHLLSTGGERIVAQTHFSTHRLKTMLEFYPDARFVYVVRNPLEVLPSYLSLLHKTIEFRCGALPPPEMLRRYDQRRYEAMKDLYGYFSRLWNGGELPRDRVMVLPYQRMVADLAGSCAEVASFCGLPLTPAMREMIEAQAAGQRGYRRAHQVLPLEAFGFSEEQVRKDLAFVFEEYGFDRRAEGREETAAAAPQASTPPSTRQTEPVT
ncbi:MAG: sulfotransferase [Thermodesulfobacteriota bacterium]